MTKMRNERESHVRYRILAADGTAVAGLTLFNERGDHLGYVTLEYNDRECWGQMMCVTDYGSYAYRWTGTGGDFVGFLKKSFCEYITEKMAQGHGEAREFRADESRERIREEFLRTSAAEDADWAGERLEALRDCECEADFYAWAEESGIDDVYKYFRCGWGGYLEGFCRVLLPELKRALAGIREEGFR